MDNYVVGRNAIKEALRADMPIQRILVQEDLNKGPVQDILKIAKEQRIEVRRVGAKQLQKYGTEHQGVVAFVASVAFQELDEVLTKEEGTPLLILLDGIEDPHNMGAIIRTAECAGATAVLIPKRHSAPINATVAKTSVGAISHVPLVQIGNVAQTIEQLKKYGFWILGADMGGESMYASDMKVPLVIVIGNEGKGISRIVKEKCDFIVSIPMFGEINSLNASVAAALLMYEAVRQRIGK